MERGPGGEVFKRALKASLGLYKRGCVPESGFFQYDFSAKDFAKMLAASGFGVSDVYYLYVHRLLLEEIPLYRWLATHRGSKYWQKLVTNVFDNRDGHMVLFIAQKL